MLIFKIFFFLIFLFRQISTNPASRIIGGNPAWDGQFPFAAAIHVQTASSTFFCGGALTGNDWIVTAGHCVYNAVLFTIQLGSVYLDTDDPAKLTVATSAYYLHPDFKPDTIENDIGIIQFRRPIDYTIYLSPIYALDIDVGISRPYVLGWGQTSDSESGLSNQLNYALLSTISNDECKMTYGNQVTDNMVCVVGNYNEGTCIGDNGSPLVVTVGKAYSLVGIASFISNNGCESTDPSGYTRTHPYWEWVRSITHPDE